MCFSAAIEYRQLKFLVKIPIIYVHLLYTLVLSLSVRPLRYGGNVFLCDS